ncbi:VOC family protein [Vaginella massiliensis]|uniref:VOC family protein n=1 Tax=Vaginella massiliensis TaxID=1816680 RepID=UPI003751C272
MATTNIYLNFDVNCEEAFNFYKSVFGGEFNYIGRFGDMPESDEYKVAETDKNKIIHVSFSMGSSVLMGSDCGGDWSPTFKQGNNFSLAITADSKEEANAIFNALAVGGIITMPQDETFWGDYFGMLIDKFGIN